MESEKYIGEVIWFDNRMGYGFITRVDEEDIFVHWSDIESEGYKTLKKGQKVAYSIGLNNKNKPKAIAIVVIENE